MAMAEVCISLLLMAEGRVAGVEWEGDAGTVLGRQQDEMAAHDMARSGYPMSEPLTVAQPVRRPAVLELNHEREPN